MGAMKNLVLDIDILEEDFLDLVGESSIRLSEEFLVEIMIRPEHVSKLIHIFDTYRTLMDKEGMNCE